MWRGSHFMNGECLPWLTAVIHPSSFPGVGSWLLDLEAYTISFEDIGPNVCWYNELWWFACNNFPFPVQKCFGYGRRFFNSSTLLHKECSATDLTLEFSEFENKIQDQQYKDVFAVCCSCWGVKFGHCQPKGQWFHHSLQITRKMCSRI